MKKSLFAAGFVALSFAAVAPADAWVRQGAFAGPHGGFGVNAGGSCAGGACSRSVTRTGAGGQSMTHNGHVACGGGSCSSSSSTTGPRGKSTSHTGSFTD